MKLIRKTAKTEALLWDFVASHLPDSLRATKHIADGYGIELGIEVKDKSVSSYLPFRASIATVTDDSIELRSPQYFSDMEEIIRKWEAFTGKEVTLIYWES